jgi:RNA polymerase sigma-70 factor (ECF subfamily)
MRYALRSLADPDVAQDVCQDTFLRAFRAYRGLPPEANHRAWLYRIASNLCHDTLRRRSRRQMPLDDSIAAHDCLDGNDRELAGAVVLFVHSLPRRQRQAMILRKFQEMSYDEIGEVLGCTPETARASVYQALRKVKAHFAEVTDV